MTPIGYKQALAKVRDVISKNPDYINTFASQREVAPHEVLNSLVSPYKRSVFHNMDSRPVFDSLAKDLGLTDVVYCRTTQTYVEKEEGGISKTKSRFCRDKMALMVGQNTPDTRWWNPFNTLGDPQFAFYQKRHPEQSPRLQVDAFRHELLNALSGFYGGEYGVEKLAPFTAYNEATGAFKTVSGVFVKENINQYGPQWDADRNMDWYNNRLGAYRGLEAYRRNHDGNPYNNVSLEDLIAVVYADVQNGTAITEPWKEWYGEEPRIATEMAGTYNTKIPENDDPVAQHAHYYARTPDGKLVKREMIRNDQ